MLAAVKNPPGLSRMVLQPLAVCHRGYFKYFNSPRVLQQLVLAYAKLVITLADV